MGRFVKGDIVVVPFSLQRPDHLQAPARLVLAELSGDDLILCQITSQAVRDAYAVSLRDDDYDTGGLSKPSNARPNRLFTVDRHIVLYKAGSLKKGKTERIVDALVEILRK